MVRRGLPAKYAKMGFKKGWKAYKASKRRRGPSKRKASVSSPSAKKQVRRMGRTKFERTFWRGIGAGGKGLAGAYVTKQFPEFAAKTEGFTDDIVGGALGTTLDNFTKKQLKDVGQGMQAAAIGGAFEQLANLIMKKI